MRTLLKTNSEKRGFLENLLRILTNEETIDYNKTELWYKLSREFVKKNGGRSLFCEGKSLIDILKEFYPENDLHAWLFENGNVPLNYWENKENHKLYIKWYLELKGLKKNDVINYEECYKIKNEDLCKARGGSLINLKYNYSVYNLLQSTIEYDWLPWKFTNSPNNFWSGENKKQNTIWYLKWLFDKLQFTSKKDYYKLTKHDFINNYGVGLLSLFHGKIMDILKFAFPNDDTWEWRFWRFVQTQKNMWKDISNQREFMDYVHRKLSVKCQEEMYGVFLNDILNLGGSSLVSNYYRDNIYNLYKNIYPELKWDKNKFYWKNKTEKKVYIFLEKYLSTISNSAVSISIHREYCVEWCKNVDTGKNYRYDFLIKITFSSGQEIFIIIELDGQQHFEFCKNNRYNKQLSYIERHERDLYKMNVALEQKYHFIRLFQPDIWYDNITWENELSNTIDYILLNYQIPIIKYISRDNIYNDFKSNQSLN